MARWDGQCALVIFDLPSLALIGLISVTTLLHYVPVYVSFWYPSISMTQCTSFMMKFIIFWISH
ncbi:hypothetical protein C8J56DRAFT_956910 [Mycena floridula]|nr:hypothetical protein C8J56DRAFT_956910 [Mycena floridula]